VEGDLTASARLRLLIYLSQKERGLRSWLNLRKVSSLTKGWIDTLPAVDGQDVFQKGHVHLDLSESGNLAEFFRHSFCTPRKFSMAGILPRRNIFPRGRKSLASLYPLLDFHKISKLLGTGIIANIRVHCSSPVLVQVFAVANTKIYE